MVMFPWFMKALPWGSIRGGLAYLRLFYMLHNLFLRHFKNCSQFGVHFNSIFEILFFVEIGTVLQMHMFLFLHHLCKILSKPIWRTDQAS
jgi:hypothetical protein